MAVILRSLREWTINLCMHQFDPIKNDFHRKHLRLKFGLYKFVENSFKHINKSFCEIGRLNRNRAEMHFTLCSHFGFVGLFFTGFIDSRYYLWHKNGWKTNKDRLK